MESSSFEVSYPSVGFLPGLPLQNFDPLRKKELYMRVESTYRSITIVSADSYWTGKHLGKVSELAVLADQVGHGVARDFLLNVLKTSLEDWFTAEGKSFFYYDDNIGSLIGYPASYGSDTDLVIRYKYNLQNDHHFHYGISNNIF